MSRFSPALLLLLAGVAACSTDTGDDNATTTDESSLTSSKRAGMGATFYGDGTTFRLWAPGARRVWVVGDFNGWFPEANELGNEFNGNFSGDVPAAKRWQKYKYVIEGPDGTRFWKADPRAQRMENSSGSSIIHDPGAYWWNNGGFQLPGFRDQIIYEMHIGTFTSPYGGVGGWKSATEKLQYLADLGVNMLEVMPVAEFPGDRSWGYNPSQPMAPESAYGTPEEMKAFIDAAHGKGMGVIIDVVANHWGPNDLPMWCVSGDCMGNGGPYFYTDWRASTPWGHTRPDYGRQEVRDYIKDMAQMWLNEYHADGLRWDGTKWMRTTSGDGSDELGGSGTNMLKWINDTISREQPWKLKSAEDFGDHDWLTKRTAWGGVGFDAQWDGGFVHPIRDAVIKQNDEWRSMASVKAAIEKNYNGQATQRIIYTESHDEVANGESRLPERIWPGNAAGWAARKRSTLAAAIAFTSPGIPLMFMGQEFLEDGWFSAEDPLDWWKADHFTPITQLYRDLTHLRRNWTNNTRGLRGDHVSVFHVNDTQKVIAYHRWDQGGPGDDVVVVANFSGQYFSDYRVGFPRGGLWYCRFNSDSSNYSSDFGNTATRDTNTSGGGQDGLGQSASFALGPYSVAIFSQ